MAKYKFLYDKKYFETYACLCLNDVLNLDLILREDRYGVGNDRPDLISKDEKIGIEVTRSESQESCRATKLFQQNYPKENRQNCLLEESIRLKLVDKTENIYGHIVLEQDFCAKTIQKEIYDSLNAKIEKLNDIYNIYDSNRLCLFSDKDGAEIITALIAYFKINEYKLHKYKHLFDTIYVIDNDKLIVFKDINTYEIKSIKSYKKEAQKLLNY